MARDGDFGRGQNRDRGERESGDRRDDSDVNDLGKVHVGNVMVESGSCDEYEVECGESVQCGNDSVFGLEGRHGPSERDSLENKNGSKVEKEKKLDEADLCSRK